MPRALILGLVGLVLLAGARAQAAVPLWDLTVSTSAITAGVPFDVTAEVRLPAGYYQDADSAFLAFEPEGPFRVTARASSTPVLRAGKNSFTGTFTLTRTLVLEGAAPSELSFRLGWQICKADGVCLLPVERTQKLSLQNPGAAPSPDIGGWLQAAFVGGLLLNLMPCVFPVLALKGLGIAAAANRNRRDRRRDALAFAAGSFSTVFALGLLTTALALFGQRLDWGFPFQQPLFVWALALAFAALTLQLWGLWQTGWSPFTLSAKPRGPGSSWAAGAFLVLAAAPCTAPLLGPALGFALGRPPLEIPLYFTAIGLGLAAPLLVLQAVPEWSRLLPKPGRWMQAVERLAGVLLALTAAYLLWVVGEQLGGAALAVAALGLVLFCAALVLGRPGAAVWRRLLLAASLACALLLVLPHETPKPAELRGWKVYSAEALNAALAEGRPVLIDATAAWCATCQINELAVLNTPETAALMDSLGLERLRADYTRPDPEVHDWLNSVGRAGLPVYALYRPGKPLYLFPELLNEANFNTVLRQLVQP